MNITKFNRSKRRQYIITISFFDSPYRYYYELTNDMCVCVNMEWFPSFKEYLYENNKP